MKVIVQVDKVKAVQGVMVIVIIQLHMAEVGCRSEERF